MHGKIRESMVIVSVAVPRKLREILERKAKLDSKTKNLSDSLREILLDYVRDSIPVEDLAEIVSEIEKTRENRK